MTEKEFYTGHLAFWMDHRVPVLTFDVLAIILNLDERGFLRASRLAHRTWTGPHDLPPLKEWRNTLRRQLMSEYNDQPPTALPLPYTAATLLGWLRSYKGPRLSAGIGVELVVFHLARKQAAWARDNPEAARLPEHLLGPWSRPSNLN